MTRSVPDRFLKVFTETPHPIPDPDPIPWPLLHKVILDRALNGEYGDPIVPIPHLELWKAPNLKCISWNAIWHDFLSVETNWGQLEGIEVTGDDQSQYAYEFDGGPYCEFSAQEARRILAATPMLRTLKIALAQHDQMRGLGQGQLSTVSVPQPLVLQHLTKLDLVDTYIDPATKPTIFLEHLQLPALEHLTYDLFNSNIDNLNSSQPHPPADDPFLLRFIRAQKQPVRIKKLAISATAISRKGFLECLRRMPLLEQLWVTFGTLQARLNEDGEDITLLETEDERLKWDVRPDDEMLQAFMVDERARAETDQILCPKLHSIRLDRSICSLEAVKVLVDHRNRLSKLAAVPPCVPFRRLSIDLPVPRPIFVPRSARRLATCELEEELREIGIDATLKLRDHNGLHRSSFQPYTAKSWHRYDPNDGLPQANSCYRQQLEEDRPWS
ncbi:hypothetical protein NMY22_g3684 [Coprinellus aureogranulatus]|nr:hypothetical protein NMY22_g3684 [Coprinellus aureogranulatus]